MTQEETKVLVVDDSSTMRRILKVALARCGYNDVTEASNGCEALNKCKETAFNCILTDWNMPEMDGLEMTMQLRKLPEYEKTPIMMVTTEGAKQDVIEALTKGINAYIVKPFTPDTLKQKMGDLMAKA